MNVLYAFEGQSTPYRFDINDFRLLIRYAKARIDFLAEYGLSDREEHVRRLIELLRERHKELRDG